MSNNSEILNFQSDMEILCKYDYCIKLIILIDIANIVRTNI